MVITTMLAYVVAREHWGWNVWRAGGIIAAFLAIDLVFFGANLLKIHRGGWFPLLVAGLIYAVMSTWKKGRELVVERLRAAEVPLEDFLRELAAHPPIRVPGTAIFMTAREEGAPPILARHLEHNRALHAQVVLLTVSIVNTPTVGEHEAIEVTPVSGGFFRMLARYGFMEPPNVPAALERARKKGLDWRDADTTFYLAHLTLLPSDRLGMSVWRDKLFIFVSGNERRATNFFKIPADRVVEIGIQLEI